MNLAYRAAETRDFAACIRLLHGHRAYDAETLAILPQAWTRLLNDKAIIFYLIEDRDRPVQSRVLAFGASVFVTDAFMRESREAPKPKLTARLMHFEMSGSRTHILRRAAIAAANAKTGVNSMVVHYAESISLTNPELTSVRYSLMEAFLWAHRGYRVREVLQELGDEIDPAFAKQGWGRIRSSYAEFFGRDVKTNPVSGRQPYLIGLTREEALATPGSIGAPLFIYSAARFRFSEGSQELLQKALAGHTDTALAKTLHVSLPTVKSRWRTIYEKVEAVAPELLPQLTISVAESKRGKEKRRRVLDYIRHHPEELCPIQSQRFTAASKRSPRLAKLPIVRPQRPDPAHS